MRVESKKWGLLNDGREIYLFRLISKTGAYLEFSNWGASWISAFLPDSSGKLTNSILSYSCIDDYILNHFYFGSTIGRFANRISGSGFVIGNCHYDLEANDGQHSNHGGTSGFSHKLWDAEIYDYGIIFSLRSPDGEGGYPGNVEVQMNCSFNDEHILRIEFNAKTDKTTFVNLTNHAYFNLSSSDSVKSHLLKIEADEFLETNSEFIPTGNFCSVKGSPFDFTERKIIGSGLNSQNQQIKWNRGYNHCYVLSWKKDTLIKHAVDLKDPSSGRRLEVWTSYPGILIYTANYLDPSIKAKGGERFKPYQGVCLEAQFFPDSPNHENFPLSLLKEDEEYHQIIEYRFFTS